MRQETHPLQHSVVEIIVALHTEFFEPHLLITLASRREFEQPQWLAQTPSPTDYQNIGYVHNPIFVDMGDSKFVMLEISSLSFSCISTTL